MQEHKAKLLTLKNGLLMNLHAKELGDVIMWTIGNFEENGPKFCNAHRKSTKLKNKKKTRLQHITGTLILSIIHNQIKIAFVHAFHICHDFH